MKKNGEPGGTHRGTQQWDNIEPVSGQQQNTAHNMQMNKGTHCSIPKHTSLTQGQSTNA